MREREWVREMDRWKKYNKRTGNLVGRDIFYQKILDLFVRKLNHMFAINLGSQHYILFLVINTGQLLFQWALHVSIISPSICHEVMGQDAMTLVFWMLSFKATLSLSSFTFIKSLFSFSLLSAIVWCHLHIWGYWYFSQQSWFQLVLHPAQHFSWCTLHIS